MQGAAFMGAFFRVSPLGARGRLDEAQLIDGIRAQLQKKFGKLGDRVVEDNLRVIRRGYDELRGRHDAWRWRTTATTRATVPPSPPLLDVDGRGRRRQPGPLLRAGLRVGAAGQDPIADPFARSARCRP
jgi:hypothetical protein